MTSELPLSGTVVVDLSRMLPGAVLVRTLVDLGARVIKVEDPAGGDPMRATPPLVGGTGVGFATFFRGVESVALDLRGEAGAAAARRLASHADVLVESFRPGTLERWGLGLDRLQALNPVLVTCSLSSFGTAGPLAGRVGHDLNFVAMTGLLDRLGASGVPRVQLADVTAGLLGAASVLSALLLRHRTGRGSRIDQPLVTGPLPFLAWAFAEDAAGGADVVGDLLGGGMPAYRTYACGDGRRVALGALEPKFWAGLCELAGLPEHAGDGLDGEAGGRAAAAALEAKLSERPRDEWLERAAARGIPLTAVNDLSGGRAATAAWSEETAAPGGGTIAAPGPFLGAAPRGRPLRAAPALGADTARVLSEVGYTAEEARRLAS